MLLQLQRLFNVKLCVNSTNPVTWLAELLAAYPEGVISWDCRFSRTPFIVEAELYCKCTFGNNKLNEPPPSVTFLLSPYALRNKFKYPYPVFVFGVVSMCASRHCFLWSTPLNFLFLCVNMRNTCSCVSIYWGEGRSRSCVVTWLPHRWRNGAGEPLTFNVLHQ
jgi:hypothetical protein